MNVPFDLVLCKTRHEDVRIDNEAFGAALGAAPLEVGNLLNADRELRFPCILGDFSILPVEYLVDRVGTVGKQLAHRSRRPLGLVFMMSLEVRVEKARIVGKGGDTTHLQAPSLR